MAIKVIKIELTEQINPVWKLEKYKGVRIGNLALGRQVFQAVGNFDVVRELLGSLQSPFAYREGYLQAQRLAALFGVEPLVAAGGVR
ncbi:MULTISPECIES: hypothetical protein [unclassified Microcoleus]|uniref:hypothetical protein n=1 Tax=unclassified Microcoleus TaxID=2642155 RepID=UPI002FD57943